MSGGFPIGQDLCNATEYGSAGGGSGIAPGTVVAPSASANTKGSWVQITASTTADICAVLVQIQNFGSGQFAVDIGIGGAGSEIVIANNILCSLSSNASPDPFFPCSIPSGTRIAARCQSSAAADFGVVVNVTGFDGSYVAGVAPSGLDAIGFNSATTLGTQITASGTGFVKGSYAQLTASTARDYAGFLIAFDDAGAGGDVFVLDLAIGGAGSEMVILPNMVLNYDTGIPQFLPLVTCYFPIPIPSGTRIAARLADVFNTSQSVGAVVYGVYQ